ncbi:MAG: hypothetical protein H6644_13740 [Caldilineaceae bacterium]|nr:hypothetical protein [Caldilineaceae bacterium]
MAKMVPAMGALKVAAMPAAAPHATSVFTRSSEKAQELAQRRTQRRAHLDDGPFAAGGTARADGQRRGQHFGGRHPRADAPALDRHRLHDFGHAVALGLAGKFVDDETDGRARQPHGQQCTHDHADGCGQAFGQHGDELEQVDEDHRAQPRADADEQGRAYNDEFLRDRAPVEEAVELCS